MENQISETELAMVNAYKALEAIIASGRPGRELLTETEKLDLVQEAASALYAALMVPVATGYDLSGEESDKAEKAYQNRLKDLGLA